MASVFRSVGVVTLRETAQTAVMNSIANHMSCATVLLTSMFALIGNVFW